MRYEQFDSGDAGPTASSARHASSFPYCGRYLRYWCSADVLRSKVPDRWKTFVKWAGKEEMAVEACTWGKGPLVQINSARVGHAMGRTTASDKGEVCCFIHGKVANAYEQGTGWIIWESTVLHELVHWCRWRLRIRDDPDVEPGKAFEAEAYGADVDLKTPWRPGP